MAIKISVHLEDNLSRKYFGKLPDFINKALNNAIKKSAFVIEAEAKRVTPVRTGRLRSSIYTTLGNLKAVVQPKTNYALAVHEGTSRMKGRPYMVHGMQNAKDEVEKIFNDEIKKAIK